MVDPQMGHEVPAFVFMIEIIGGLDSIKGSLIGEEPHLGPNELSTTASA